MGKAPVATAEKPSKKVQKTEAPEAQALTEDEAALAAAREKKKRSMREEVTRRREALKRQEAERKLPQQFLLIIGNSFLVGVVTSLMAIFGLRNLPRDSAMIASEMSQFLLFMSFILGFFVSLLFLMRRLPPNWLELISEHAKTETYVAPSAKWGGALTTERSAEYAPLFDMSQAKAKKDGMPATLAVKEDDAPFTDAQTSPTPDAADSETTGEALSTPEAAAPPEDAVAQAKEQAAAELDKFVAAALAAIQAAGRTLDAASKFAMQLYLAGACSAAAKRLALSAADAFAMMVRTLMASGTGKAFSESFAQNVEHYAQRDNYRAMIDAGASAMTAQFDGSASATSGMLSQFDRFAEQQPNLPKVVTLLITDIVDAAALANRLGNLHTQRVVKAHDEAVRYAISKQKGKEIQHTGDGIVSTFADPAKAVAAAQLMQERIAAHNKRQPHLSANVRVAINAGEAVQEGQALIGATMKLTALVCGLASAGQIAAADVVKSFCKTSQHLFKPLGEINIAELGKARPVYEVTWLKEGGVEYSDIGRPAQ
jgi:class 3 adenylate cyclase